ncbi:MAG: hypothetical protein JRJ19_09285 [Deltaproteobacteria bacterium]|nr:hypothetical protein [Deltaproteobacteria bacterium]MBW1872246.1 hypothetical protein [Deltaproteobacteria bacterium]
MKQLSIIFCLVCLVGPTEVLARDYSVSVGATGQIAASRDFDPLSDDDEFSLAHVEVGIELDEVLPGLSLEVAWEAGSVSNQLYAGPNPWLSTELAIHGLILSASYRLPLTTWLNGTVRLGGTLDFARLQFTQDDQILLSDWSMARVGIVGTAGVEFLLPRNLWRTWFDKPKGDPDEGFTMGLRFELGWSYRQAFVFDQMRPSDTDKLSIVRSDMDIGGVHIDGLLFRVGLVAVF